MDNLPIPKNLISIDDLNKDIVDYIFLSFLILLNVMNFVDRQLLASFANFIIPKPVDLEIAVGVSAELNI